MKRFIAILLAMVMVLGLGTMAMATAPNDKVQINNMMVDASKAEVKTEETTAMYAAENLATTATTVSYPPIQKISVDWTNSTVTADDTSTTATYNMVLYGAKSTDLSNRSLTFKFSTNPAISSDISVAFDTKTVSGAAGSTKTMSGVTLAATQTFTVTWTETKNGVTTNKSVTCTLNVTTPAAASVNLTSVEIAGTAATYSDTTVGGVTRYNYAATLPSGTATTALDAATVVVTPASTSATMTLKNSNGTDATEAENITFDSATHVYTFSNVNFNAGTKTLTVSDGGTSRDYQVSASIDGQEVTVYIAIRTYTVFDWLDGTTSSDYYDYVSNGYGSGADLSSTEYTRISDIATALAANNLPNEPDRSSGNKQIFDEGSYYELPIAAGSSVMDALTAFLEEVGLYETGASNNYVSSMGTGSSTSAQIGEFDCGYASGWMYTARNAIDDLDSPLPNAGAKDWAVSNGMYIDWYYTAAYGMDFGYSMFDI